MTKICLTTSWFGHGRLKDYEIINESKYPWQLIAFQCVTSVFVVVIPIPPIPIDVVSRLGLLMDVCSFNDPEAPAPVAPEVSPKKRGNCVDMLMFGFLEPYL